MRFLKGCFLVAIYLFMATSGFASELHIGIATTPPSLDPKLVASVGEQRVLLDLLEGLVILAPDGSVLPGAAESWQETPDHLVWTFKLRKEAKWSNGSPVTADDFAFGIKRTAKTKSPLLPIVGIDELRQGRTDVKFGVIALDTRTLEITLSRPQYSVLERLTEDPFLPVPKDLVEKLEAKWTNPGNMISNGPYILSEVALDGSIVLKKSSSYWAAINVKIDRVIFKIAEASSERLRLFKLGQIDITGVRTPRDIAEAEKQFFDRLKKGGVSLHTYLQINPERLAWAHDRNIRRALSLAIDRESIANKVLGGSVDATTVILPPGLQPYGSPEPPEWPATQALREEEARRLWALSGATRPKKVVLELANSQFFRLSAAAIGENWQRVLGIKLEMKLNETEVIYRLRSERNYGLAFGFFNTTFADRFLTRLVLEGDPANNYVSKNYQKTLNEFKSSKVPAKQFELIRKLEAQLIADAFMIPVNNQKQFVLVSGRVRNFRMDHARYHLDIRSADLEIVE